jgi:excisionase family DNA binding protein
VHGQVNAAAVVAPLEGTVSPEVFEAAVRAVAAALSPRRTLVSPAVQDGGGEDRPPLLSPPEAGKMLGVSRNTIDRMVADRELPSIVLREGARQRVVKIPRAFLEQLLGDLTAGVQVSLKDYTARWLASVAARAGDPVPPPGRVPAAEVA